MSDSTSRLADAALAENVSLKRELETSKETLELASRELAAAKRTAALLEAKLKEVQEQPKASAVSDAEVLGVVAPELKEALHEIEKVKKELEESKKANAEFVEANEYLTVKWNEERGITVELEKMCKEMYAKVEKAEATILELDRSLTKAGYASAQYRNTLICVCNMLQRQFPEVDMDSVPDVVASLVREFEKSKAATGEVPNFRDTANSRIEAAQELVEDFEASLPKADTSVTRDEIDILLAEGV